MTDRELRKLSRKDLLELLLAQEKARVEIEDELRAAKAALADRQLKMERAGNLAEAALQLNGVFEAAQAAAQQYMENVKELCRQQELENQERIDQTWRRVQEWVRRTEDETRIKCEKMEKEAKMRVKGKTFTEAEESSGRPE